MLAAALSQVADQKQYYKYDNNRVNHWESPFLYFTCRGGLSAAPAIFKRSTDLYDPHQVQNKEDGGNHDQGMDPIACPRETWTDVRPQKA